MTEISHKNIQCSCGQVNRILYFSSFYADYLDNPSIQELLKGRYATGKCKNCGKLLQASVSVLINSPEGMVWVISTDDPENIRNILSDKGLSYKEPIQIRSSQGDSIQPPPPLNLNELSDDVKERIQQKNLNESDKKKLEEYLIKKRKRKFLRFL